MEPATEEMEPATIGTGAASTPTTASTEGKRQSTPSEVEPATEEEKIAKKLEEDVKRLSTPEMEPAKINPASTSSSSSTDQRSEHPEASDISGAEAASPVRPIEQEPAIDNKKWLDTSTQGQPICIDIEDKETMREELIRAAQLEDIDMSPKEDEATEATSSERANKRNTDEQIPETPLPPAKRRI